MNKFPVWLLAASLAANGALIAALARRSEPSFPSVTATRPAAASTAGAKTKPAVSAEIAPAALPLWSALQTENLDEFGRRLRGAGFPPKTVRMLIAQKLQDRWEADSEAILGRREDVPYWKPGWISTFTPEQRARLDEMSVERRALEFKYVSGPDALAEDEDAQALARRRFGNLSLDKLQQVTALQHDFEDLQMKLSRTAMTDPKARETAMASHQALEKEQTDQLAKILTPAELEQYELRTKSGYLAQQLMAFKPSEDEFKAIYALEKSQQHEPTDPNATPAQRQEEYEQRLAATLGAERALDYLELRKAGSDRLPLLISRLNLPLSTLGSINRVKSDISQRAQAITNDPSLTPSQRQAQLAGLAQEANEKLTATLGSQRGYEAYMDLKGDWVRSLKPRGP